MGPSLNHKGVTGLEVLFLSFVGSMLAAIFVGATIGWKLNNLIKGDIRNEVLSSNKLNLEGQNSIHYLLVKN